MKKRRSIILIVISILLSSACTTEPGGEQNGEGRYTNEIPCYYVALEGLKAHEGGFGVMPITGSVEKHYVLMLDYDVRRLTASEEAAFRETTGERKGKYLHWDADGDGGILCHRFDRILITSSADFNGIPSGEPLSSKIMLFTWSVWPSVNAGKDVGNGSMENDLYHQYFYVHNPIPNFPSYSIISKKMNQLNAYDLYLIGADRGPVLFMFTELPEIKQHVFTLSFHEGNRVWSIDIPAVFTDIKG